MSLLRRLSTDAHPIRTRSARFRPPPRRAPTTPRRTSRRDELTACRSPSAARPTSMHRPPTFGRASSLLEGRVSPPAHDRTGTWVLVGTARLYAVPPAGDVPARPWHLVDGGTGITTSSPSPSAGSTAPAAAVGVPGLDGAVRQRCERVQACRSRRGDPDWPRGGIVVIRKNRRRHAPRLDHPGRGVRDDGPVAEAPHDARARPARAGRAGPTRTGPERVLLAGALLWFLPRERKTTIPAQWQSIRPLTEGLVRVQLGEPPPALGGVRAQSVRSSGPIIRRSSVCPTRPHR